MGGSSSATLILPVEIQVRELDAKILLACVAARSGIPVVIGRIKDIHANLPSYPRGIYLSKGMGHRSVRNFEFIRGFGHVIAALDEEALVHYPPELHFMKRVSPEAGRFLSHLFAWGPENEKLWRSAPQFRESKIHLTGNPRGDLLRKELLPYFAPEAQQLRSRYGEFVLINTNFPTVNSNRGIYVDEPGAGGARTPGLGARDLTPDFAANLHRHRMAHFRRFRSMIPELARAFPDLTIVVRPHPSEHPEPYLRIARECNRVSVENDGNAIPWMLAARATIQNGCTTGVEANLMGVPTIAFGPVRDDSYDFGLAFELPNRLSHDCPQVDSLVETLRRILKGDLACATGADRDALMDEFFSARNGALASERIVSVLHDAIRERGEPTDPSIGATLDAWRRIHALRFEQRAPGKWLKRLRRGSARSAGARKAVYPTVSPPQMRERVDRFSQLTGHDGRLRIEPIGRHVYRVET